MRSLLTVAGLVVSLSAGLMPSELKAEPPQTVEDFLATCARGDPTSWNDDYTECVSNISAVEIVKGAPHLCEPPDTSAESERLAVMKWLNDHSGMSNADKFEGIRAALTALYPCS